MKRRILSAPARGVLAVLLAVGSVPASGQNTLPNLSTTDEAPPELDMAEAGDVLRMKVGYSRLLHAEEPFGTIIVGDDTIANATVGSGNSIIVTGLSAGSTNLIVLGESQGVLMSSTIAVSPAAGPLRSAVTVHKGTATRERYECRGTSCTLVEPDDQSTEISSIVMPARQRGASGEDAAAAE